MARIGVRSVALLVPCETGGVREEDVALDACAVRPVEHPSVRTGSPSAATEARPARSGVAPKLAALMSSACRCAVYAGMRALERAELLDETHALPEALRDGTGVIFASSFAHHEGAMRDVRARAREETRRALRDHVDAGVLDARCPATTRRTPPAGSWRCSSC